MISVVDVLPANHLLLLNVGTLQRHDVLFCFESFRIGADAGTAADDEPVIGLAGAMGCIDPGMVGEISHEALYFLCPVVRAVAATAVLDADNHSRYLV